MLLISLTHCVLFLSLGWVFYESCLCVLRYCGRIYAHLLTFLHYPEQGISTREIPTPRPQVCSPCLGTGWVSQWWQQGWGRYCVLVRILYRNTKSRIYTYELYYKILAHTNMEAKKSHDLPFASQSPRNLVGASKAWEPERQGHEKIDISISQAKSEWTSLSPPSCFIQVINRLNEDHPHQE